MCVVMVFGLFNVEIFTAPRPRVILASDKSLSSKCSGTVSASDYLSIVDMVPENYRSPRSVQARGEARESNHNCSPQKARSEVRI